MATISASNGKATTKLEMLAVIAPPLFSKGAGRGSGPVSSSAPHYPAELSRGLRDAATPESMSQKGKSCRGPNGKNGRSVQELVARKACCPPRYRHSKPEAASEAPLSVAHLVAALTCCVFTQPEEGGFCWLQSIRPRFTRARTPFATTNSPRTRDRQNRRTSAPRSTLPAPPEPWTPRCSRLPPAFRIQENWWCRLRPAPWN